MIKYLLHLNNNAFYGGNFGATFDTLEMARAVKKEIDESRTAPDRDGICQEPLGFLISEIEVFND